jgi:hypothetical protein
MLYTAATESHGQVGSVTGFAFIDRGLDPGPKLKFSDFHEIFCYAYFWS